MLRWVLPLVLSGFAAGCACGPPAMLVPDGGAVDAGSGLPTLDAADLFAIPDVPDGLLPACTDVERLTTTLPSLEEGQVVVQGFEDRVLLIERPNSPPPPYTSILRFYLARRGEPFVLLAEHAFGRNVGLVRHVRFRDGAWDVIVDVFAQEGTIAWLRVSEDGAIEETEHRGPGAPPLEVRAAFPDGPDYVLLAADVTDSEATWSPIWILRATADPAGDEAVLLAPPGVHPRHVVAQPERGRVLLLEHDPVVGRPPRIAVVPFAPLAAPAPEAWHEIALPYETGVIIDTNLFSTSSGLVLGEFVRHATEPSWLRLAWLDDAFGVLASYRVDTVVNGSLAVAGAFPAQEIVVTLPDAPDLESGPATIFHGRASAPGVVSALTPIGRTFGVSPPQLVVGLDGRVEVLHVFDRLDTEVLCEAP